jgi:enamine deaminase RidA (YjgF/YER057c/UK114 family)
MRHASATSAGALLSLVFASGLACGQNIRRIESTLPGQIGSAAVLVDDVPLVHTAQLLPVNESGQIVGSGDVRVQFEQVLARLRTCLTQSGSNLSRTLQLNCYLARGEDANALTEVLGQAFPAEQRSAISIVTTPLPHPEALVAFDAVAASQVERLTAIRLDADSATLPAGSRIYISGQAEPGTLREATQKTLASLSATLRHCGRTDSDVVQLKCFLQPLTSAHEVQEEIARHFGPKIAPSISFVEWKSTAPIEIELVAWGGPANPDAAQTLEFITPPGMQASPLYSRVARINHGGTIFFSQLATNENNVRSTFEALQLLLEKSGSSMQHLVKATYYVTDDEVSKKHNETRPRYYDPNRPPSASKAMVAGCSGRDARYAMDIIAIPSSRGTPASGPEQGFGLTAQEAATGWLSIYDGETTFGWKDAAAENGMLRGGATMGEFGPCQVRGQFTGAGAISVGGELFAVSGDVPLRLDATKVRAPIKIGEGVGVKSLAVRPLELQPLFNQRDLTGWQAIGRKGPIEAKDSFWNVQEKVPRAVGGPGAIEYTGRQFGDAVIQLDVRTRAVHSNGGLFFRAIPGDFMNGYEAQLHNRCLEDDPAKPFRYCTGGIDDRQDARRQVARDFVTFRMTVIATGPHIATWVNGYQTVAWTDDRQPHDNPREGQRLKPGAIQLQAHDPATDYEVSQILAAAWE